MHKQPRCDSTIRSVRSDEPEAANGIEYDRSQSAKQFPGDDTLSPGEQLSRSIAISGSSTVGDHPTIDSSLQREKQVSSLGDPPIGFSIQMSLDDCELQFLLHLPTQY